MDRMRGFGLFEARGWQGGASQVLEAVIAGASMPVAAQW